MKTDVTGMVAEALTEETTPKEITLSTGVVLRGKQAPPLILIKVMGRFPRPKVPVTFVKNMGREMENPDDPDYQSRVQSWNMEMSEALLSALIMLGTELVSKPANFPGPMDDEWLADYELLGLDMKPENRNWRYQTWVYFKAIATADDTTKIREVVGRLSGVSEASVQAAEDFPGSKQVAGGSGSPGNTG